jgi:hypothetical protein
MTHPDEGPWPAEQLPAHDRLADDRDELGWNVDVHGRMREFATDDEPATVPWEG